MMKTQQILLVLLLLFPITFSLQAQKSPAIPLKKQEIKIWGECGMCKKIIERSALKAGATGANWNEDSKILSVTYQPWKTDGIKIQQQIATAGYDTQDFSGNNNAYSKLPGCCHYTRKESNPPEKVKTISSSNNAKNGNCAAVSGCNCSDQTLQKSGPGCCNDAIGGSVKECCEHMTVCKEKACCGS